jgi:hypothetical protein
MELTTEEKLDRLEAGLAAIERRLDAAEAEWREGLEQWEADRKRWAADEAAAGVARVRVSDEAAANDEEDRLVLLGVGAPSCGLNYENTRGALTRAAAALSELAEEESQVAAANDEEDRAFSEALKRLDMCSDGGGVEPSPRRGGRLLWREWDGLNDDKLLAGYGR